MQLDFQQLQRDSFGRLEPPTLLLKKPHGAMVGALGDYHGLKLELKYNEVSEGSFYYPKSTEQGLTPFYDQLVPDKLIQIDPYGIFVVREAEEKVTGNGLVKEVSLYSLEYELASKKVILGQGTYPLWNEADQENCLLHMVLENTRHWRVGYVDANIAQRYRTFSDTDSGVLEFLQGEVQESYGAVVVFNTYGRTINIYDASEPAPTIPVYLSYDNLLKEGTIKELGENLITKLYVQGADGVDIRNVNPTGDNYIYNLGWYIENGDLDSDLADKWQSWQREIASQQDYYANLVLVRAAETARHTAANATLTDIENSIATQENLQSVWLQTKQTATDKSEADRKLSEINAEIQRLTTQLATQKNLIATIQQRIDGYKRDMLAINQRLKLENYFSGSDANDVVWLDRLDHYLKEDTFQDETFAVFDVTLNDGGMITKAEQLSFTWQDVSVDEVQIDETDGTQQNTIYALTPQTSHAETKDPRIVAQSSDATWLKLSAALVSGCVDSANRVMSCVVGAGALWTPADSLSYEDDQWFVDFGEVTDTDGASLAVIFYDDAGQQVYQRSGLPATLGAFRASITPEFVSRVSSAKLVVIDSETFGWRKTIDVDLLKKSTFAGGALTVVCNDDGVLSINPSGLPSTTTKTSMHFTSNATDYQQMTVEQSLYDQANDHLLDAAYPTYEFEVSSGNILFQEAFQPFADAIHLGGRCYLQLDENRCLTPVLLEIHLDFESANSFKLVFANTFRRPDNVNSLKDILRETTSASRTLKSKELSYGENNTTTTWVKELLDRGFDAAMTRINSGESSVSFGKSGIKVESTEGDIIYLGNGMIALHDSTSDTVRMAMGHFVDERNGGNYVGVLADVIAGTLVAGQRLVIECPAIGSDGQETGVMQFKVDSTGVQMYNGSFYMENNGRAVCIDPTYGFMLGKQGMLQWNNGVPSPTWGVDDENNIIAIDATKFFDQEYASLWLDTSGNAYFKGNVYAVDGRFNGVVQARQFLDSQGNDIFDRETKSKFDYLDLGGIVLDGASGNIELDGNITMKGSINLSGAIKWAGGYSSPMIYQYAATNSVDDQDWHSEFNSTTDKFRRESFDGGNTWGAGYQFVGQKGDQGPQGPQGPRGSSANVPSWVTAYTASAVYNTYINDEWVISMNLYGSKIFGSKYYSSAGNSAMDLLDSAEMTDWVGVPTGAGVVFHDVNDNTLFAVARPTPGIISYNDYYGTNNTKFLTITTNGEVCPRGSWNFGMYTDCKVKGLYLRFS